MPHVNCKNGAAVIIGKGNKFLSKSWSNLLGINHRCMLSASNNDAKLFIGSKCGFSGVTIWCFKEINIGNNVRVGANTMIFDGDAHQNDPRAGEDKPIVIEDNVWIGANVMVLKGVTIGRNSLIGAGSVVTSSIPENVIAAGNPCKVIRQLDDMVIKQLEC